MKFIPYLLRSIAINSSNLQPKISFKLLFNEEYFYQISHELNTGINVMSIMFDIFPEDLELFMIILLLILFNDEIVYGTNHYCDFAIISLRKLYNTHPDYVNNILCCYSIYKQKFICNSITKLIEKYAKRYNFLISFNITI